MSLVELDIIIESTKHDKTVPLKISNIEVDKRE